VRAHGAVEPVAITERERVKLELLRPLHHLFWQGRSAQKRKCGACEKLDERGHDALNR
jgi:hypothetical protein